jgi:hypothetical protein
LHWRILQTADLLPALHASVQLGLRRDMVCQRLKVAAEDDADERRRARKYVELILRVDPGNLTARQLAVEAHVRCANEILRLEKKRGQRTVYGPTRPRERRQLRLTTRQLNHHLIAGRRQKLDAALLGDGYATLGGCHVQQGNADKAMKALRRARRLKGGDREITRLLRTIRGMPRTS